MGSNSERKDSQAGNGLKPIDPVFARRVLITVGIILFVILVLLLLWYTIRVVLLVFIGILVAVFFRGISEWVSTWSRLPRRLSLTLVILFFSLLAGAGVWALSPRISQQVNRLADELPQAVGQITQFVKKDLGLQLALQPRQTMGGVNGLFKKVGRFFSFTLDAFFDAVIVFFVSIYLAYDSEVYLKGVIRLVPIGLRKNASDLIHTLGFTLKWWLTGVFVMMLVVGTLSGVGLWLLDIPLALTLGILAGLLTFIPYFGPIISAVPAVLMALLVDFTHVVYVVLLYLLIHILEGFILAPLVQERTVFLPPILTLAAISGMGILLGASGLIVATPAMAIVLVLVRKIYIEGILGDEPLTGRHP